MRDVDGLVVTDDGHRVRGGDDAGGAVLAGDELLDDGEDLEGCRRADERAQVVGDQLRAVVAGRQGRR